MHMRDTLHSLVNAVAADLMAANASDSARVSERVLFEVNSHFQVDFSFLRHNDHNIRATVLIAEWPPRNLDPDPIGVVYFEGADSIFAQAEHLKEPAVVQPQPDNADYQQNIEEATGYPPVTLACVPLLSDGVTTGLLGFGKLGNREWLQDELNALTTIATLFAQLQARIVAEKHVHYLASHDELTGLTNRRTLLAHLDERLQAGSPGPVSILFLDLDRLRIINDHLGELLGDRFIQGFAEALRVGVDVPAEIARLAGDEFVVVPAAAMDIGAAEALANRLQKHLHQFVEIDGERIARTVSIGVAAGEPGRQDSSELLSLAEQATRSVKKSGGGQVGVFSSGMAEQ
jgi:diguanylate cyclase